MTESNNKTECSTVKGDKSKSMTKALSVYLSACLSVSNLVVIVAMWRDSTEWFTCFQFVDFQHFLCVHGECFLPMKMKNSIHHTADG